MPKETRTIMLVATEPSATRLGAALMQELSNKLKNVRYIGMGGPEMQAAGLTLYAPADAAAVMGLAEIIPAIPRIRAALHKLVKAAESEKPDLIITIDGQDFAKRLAQATHKLGISHLHYVAPKVWAWRQKRVFKLPALYTHLLTILPFETPFFQAAGLPTTYVGHPMVTQLAPYAKQRQGGEQSYSLALLPGSRQQELARHWPVMFATYRRLRKLYPTLHGILVLPEGPAAAQCQRLATWAEQDNITVVTGEDRFKSLATCRAALAKSGTNNLELAMIGVPAVVCYRMHALTHAIARSLVKISYFSLPNLVLNPPQLGSHTTSKAELVYPEFIQNAVTEENLARALVPLLAAKPPAYVSQRLAKVAKMMEVKGSPAALAAKVACELLASPRGKPAGGA